MTIPANITTELVSLQAQALAATPLMSASNATVEALQLNAKQLVNDIQKALTTTDTLDTWVAPADPISISAGLLVLITTATDDSNLSLMRGVVGRVLSNVNRVPQINHPVTP